MSGGSTFAYRLSRSPGLGRLRSWVEVGVVCAGLVVMIVAGSLASPAFRTTANLENVLRQSIVLGLVTIGQTFVLISGGIDISVGSIVKLNVLIGALILNGQDRNIPLAVAVVLLIGAGIGLGNGLVITRLRAVPFIVTFGSFFLVRGIALSVSTQPVGLTPPMVAALYDARVLGLPLAITSMALVWVIAWWVLSRRPFGRHLYAVGGREAVAALSGVRVSRLRIAVYVISGLCASLAALFTLVISGLGDPQAGDNLEFLSITAAAVGGVSLFGGRGSIVGALGGVLLLTLIGNVFQISQVNTYYQQPLQGLIILAAVALYRGSRAAG